MARGKVTCLIIFVVICVFLNVNGQKDIILLNEDNWTDILKDEWMIEFYAPWCPACKGLQETWKNFASWGADLGIKVGQVDVTTSPGLSGRFMVTALPTIFHVNNGEFRQYKGSRDKDSFMSFIVEKKWQHVEPVPYWKSPNTFQMTIVSTFFKLSQTLRFIHTKLMDDFGLPTWGSYLIFALATILLGAILGLVLVCLIDFIYPPKPIIVTTKEKRKSKSSDDELVRTFSSCNTLLNFVSQCGKSLEDQKNGHNFYYVGFRGDDDIKDDLLDDAVPTAAEEPPPSDGDRTNGSSSNPSSPNARKRKPRRAD